MSDRQRLGLCQGDCARWYDRLAHELPLSYKVPAISGQGFGMRAKPSKPRPFRRLSTGTIFGSSAIHVAAMSDGCNEHQELAVFNFADEPRSEEHTTELQSLMRISYDVFCLKKKIKK